MAITVGKSALPALSQAITTALKADVTFTSLAQGPFDPPKEGQAFPFVDYGEHEEKPWYTFQNAGREAFFVMHIWSQQIGTSSAGYKQCYDILDAILGALETQTLVMDDFEMTEKGFLLDEAAKMPLQPDGVTKHLALRFHTWLRRKTS